jgi:hypothetical protein
VCCSVEAISKRVFRASWTRFPLHRLYSAFDSTSFVTCKPTCDIVSYGNAALDLGSCPHPKLQYVPELLRQLVPPVVISGCVRGKIVIDIVGAARAMFDDVIRLPFLALDLPTTNVTATRGLSEDL